MNITRYIIVFLGVSVGLWFLSLLVLQIFDFDISNGGMVLLPPLVAAMIEGNKFSRRTGRLPESAEMWKFARTTALVVMAITMIFSVIMTFIVPQLRAMMSQPMGAGLLMGAVILQALLAFLVTRFFLGFGAKSGLNGR
ncbi:MAG: ABZJ_00895 family protein [Thalassovita sp.]